MDHRSTRCSSHPVTVSGRTWSASQRICGLGNCSYFTATCSSALYLPNTSLAPLDMDFELWREPMMIVVIVLLLIIARAAYERNRMTGRPPMVSYAVPWVGSAIDLGKDPDMFFKRAMYVEQLFYAFGS